MKKIKRKAHQRIKKYKAHATPQIYHGTFKAYHFGMVEFYSRFAIWQYELDRLLERLIKELGLTHKESAIVCDAFRMFQEFMTTWSEENFYRALEELRKWLDHTILRDELVDLIIQYLLEWWQRLSVGYLNVEYEQYNEFLQHEFSSLMFLSHPVDHSALNSTFFNKHFDYSTQLNTIMQPITDYSTQLTTLFEQTTVFSVQTATFLYNYVETNVGVS